MDKVKKLEKGEHLDLSSDEDLSIAIMNLISMEEHFFFTYGKTGDAKYLDLLNEIREMRKTLLKKIIKDYEGEVWCISKHLLATSMRLMEVGTKALTKGEKKDAEDFFKKSYQLYSLFWGLNLGVVNTDNIRVDPLPAEASAKAGRDEIRENPSEKNKDQITLIDDRKKNNKPNLNLSIFDRLGVLVQKVIDCCKE